MLMRMIIGIRFVYLSKKTKVSYGLFENLISENSPVLLSNHTEILNDDKTQMRCFLPGKVE